MKLFLSKICLFNLLFLPLAGFGQWLPWTSHTNGHRVVDVKQHNGILWIGTSGGVVRIDQNNGDTTFYNRSNTTWSNYYISCVEVDDAGNLWVGTENNGIYFFDGNTWTHNPFGIILPTDKISDIIKDTLGNIYVGCRFWLETTQPFPTPHPGGILKYDGTSWTNITTNMPASDRNITQIEYDNIGQLVVAANRLYFYNGFTWSSVSNPPSVINFGSFSIDSLNRYWIFKDSASIAYHDGITWNTIPTGITIPGNNLRSIQFDSDNNLWLSSSQPNSPGLIRYDGTGFTTFTKQNSPLRDHLISSIKRIGGDLYVGYFDFELDRIDSSGAFAFIPTSNSSLHDNIAGTVYTKNNLVYACTKDPVTDLNILSVYDGTIWYETDTLPLNQLINGVEVRSMLHDSQGRWWISGYGIVKKENSGWQVFNMSNTGFPNNLVDDITEDVFGNIWIGGGGFIAQYDSPGWVVLVPPGLTGGITGIYADPQGNIWAASGSNGLYKYETSGQWLNFPDINGPLPSDNWIYDMSYDSIYDRLLLATPLGIVAYDFNSFITLNTEVAYIVEIDFNGNIWAALPEFGWAVRLKVWDATGQLIKDFIPGTEGFPYMRIESIALTADGRAFVSGYESGILEYQLVGSLGLTEPENNSVSTFTCKPNPSNNIIQISSGDGKTEINEVEVGDLLGRSLNKYNFTNQREVTLDISHYPSGIYWIRINQGNSSSQLKVVKY